MADPKDRRERPEDSASRLDGLVGLIQNSRELLESDAGRFPVGISVAMLYKIEGREPATQERFERLEEAGTGPRELELMAQGLTNTGIAKRLHLSERTVEAHVRHVLMKLDLPESEDGHRRVLAVLAHLRATQIQ